MKCIRCQSSTPWESEEDLAKVETEYSEVEPLLIYAVEKVSFKISYEITVLILFKFQIALIY